MLVQQMNKLDISSDVLQVLGFASISASIATWRTARGSGTSRTLSGSASLSGCGRRRSSLSLGRWHTRRTRARTASDKDVRAEDRVQRFACRRLAALQSDTHGERGGHDDPEVVECAPG